jgi:lysozyme
MEKRGKKKLAGVAGLGAAAILFALVPKHEGEVLTTYTDPVGIATVCYGDTDPVMARPGASYTREECLRSLERQLVAHAEPVLACTPELAGHDDVLAAAVSLAYNIGATAYSASTVAKIFMAGDWRGACAAFSLYVHAGGKVLPGLVTRRADERRLCESGLGAK